MNRLYKQDMLLKYVLDNSICVTESQKKLAEETRKHPENYMMGRPDVLQLTSNLIKLIGGKKILDVGVYTGASTLSAALAIPEDGKVYSLDVTDEYLAIGRPFWKEAGIEKKTNVILGPAVDSLQKLIDEGHSETFDFAFIDADKPNYCHYYELCMELVRHGGVIGIDNTVWLGKVIDPNDNTKVTEAIRELNSKLKHDPRINLSFLLIGDGLSLCFKK